MRGWTPAEGGQAGAWGRDEIRNATGSANFAFGSSPIMSFLRGASGVMSTSGGAKIGNIGSASGENSVQTLVFSLDNSVPTGPENVPVHIRQPIAIYMGGHA